MKGSRIIGIALTLCTLISVQTSIGQEAYLDYLDTPWVDSVLFDLSEEEKLAQTLWLELGPEIGLPAMLESAQTFSEYGLGGVIFRGSPGKKMLQWAEYCQSSARLPLSLAQSGWNKYYPGKTSLAAIASDSLRYLAGINLGTQLSSKGVTMLLSENMDPALTKGFGDAFIQVVDRGNGHSVMDGIQIIDGANSEQVENYIQSDIHHDTLEQRVRELLAFKYWTMQGRPDVGMLSGEKNRPDKASQKAFIRDLYAASLTVLKNQEKILPVKDLEKTKIACLAVNHKRSTEFQKVAGLYTQTDNYFWKAGMENGEMLLSDLAGYDLVLAGLYPGQDPLETETLLKALADKTKLVVVCFTDPKDLENRENMASLGAIPGLQALILSYETNSMTEGLAAQMLFGGIEGSGRLPMKLGDLYPRGSGLTTPGGLRLQYGFPESAGLSSKVLKPAIDSIVNAGLKAEAYPGCQVIVARKGTVVFHKAYGYHTYHRRIKVRKDDLYDLASVTKISGPLSGLMRLEGLGKFSYQNKLGDYFVALKGSDKADLELKDVLAHRAGLNPWIPYHELTLKKNGKYKKRFIREQDGGRFNIQVYDRLYLNSSFRNKIFRTIRKSELGEPVYRYSGLSFFLFPTIIEELSGQPYEEFLSEQIYHKLGAWELLYHPLSSYPISRIVPTEYDSIFRKDLVHGYVHDEGAAVMGSYAGNAGLFASSNDLLKLIEMYRRMGAYGGEQIIPSEVLKEYSSYQFPELEIRRGLGFDKPLLGEKDGTPGDYPCPGASPESFGHSGFTGTFVWADPEHEITYVFLCNRVHPTRENTLLYDLNIRTSILQSVYDSMVDP